MSTQPFCGLPARIEGANAQGLAQWPRGHTVTFGFQDPFPGFTVAQSEAVFARAVEDMLLVCGVTLAKITSGKPNVLIRKAALGTTGVLAQAQLPFPGTTGATQLFAEFNTQVRFVDAVNPSAQSFPIMPVFQHECWGHNLGLGHEQTPLPSLMDPSIGTIQNFTPQDPVAELLVARYGRPGVTPGDGGTDQCPLGPCLAKLGFQPAAVSQITRNWNATIESIRRGIEGDAGRT